MCDVTVCDPVTRLARRVPAIESYPPFKPCREHHTIGSSIHQFRHLHAHELFGRYLTVFSPEGRLYQVGALMIIGHAVMTRAHRLPSRICIQGYLWFRPHSSFCQRT
jgi:hypothetical protein